MHASNDEHGKPVLDSEKAPYGHADAPALASVFPQVDAPAVVNMSDEGFKSASQALHSFADTDTPLFPPVNVGIANAEEPQALPGLQEKDAEASDSQPPQDADSLLSFVKARPLTSVVVAAALGVLLVRLVLTRAGSRA